MNKRGMKFATLTVIIIGVFVMGYSIDKSIKEKQAGVDELGVVAVASLNSLYDGEREKYFIEKSAEYAVLNSIFSMGENGGIYDKSKCRDIEGYIVWEGNCRANNLIKDFGRYFDDSFSGYLENVNLKADDFNLDIGNLIVKGEKKTKLGIGIGGSYKERVEYKARGADNEKIDRTKENLEEEDFKIIEKYSRMNNVPHNLILAVIVQESEGNRNAASGAGCYGLMQICPKAHPGYFDGSVCGSENARNSVDCNVRAGVSILKSYYDLYKEGIDENKIRKYCKNEKYAKKYSNYTGWGAALRAYNGLGCAKGADVDYVEKILKFYYLLEGEESREPEAGRIGSYLVDSSFKVNLEYDFNDYEAIRETAGNCLKGENCFMPDYAIRREEVENFVTFEFESRKELKGIKPVIVKFALPVEAS